MQPFVLPAILNPPAPNREGGFLLASASVLILIVIALVSSFSFVIRRDFDYQSNFALGQRMAEAAVAAHNFAQQKVYQNSGTVDNANLLDVGQMDDPNMMFTKIGVSDLSLEIRGSDAAPINTSATFRAASAYLHLRIRIPTGLARLPSETIALMAGASNRGMSRMGLVGAADATDLCDGAATRVRWGIEPTACLNAAQITALGFTDVADNDLIVPAWEVALTRIDPDVVLRFPQPERPDLNTMTTHLAMDGDEDGDGNADPHAINDINRTNTTDINMAKDVGGAPLGTAGINNFRVRTGAPAIFEQGMITNGTLDILDASGDALVLNVANSGTTEFNRTGDPTLSVAGKVDYTNSLDSTIETDVTTNQINHDTMPTTIDTATTGTNVAVIADTATGSPNSVTINDAAGRLNISGTLNTGQNIAATPQNENAVIRAPTVGDDLPIFAAGLATIGTARLEKSDGTALDWSVGSIDQRGSAAGHMLRMDSLRSDSDCLGRGCPDNITTPPTTGGL